MIKIQLIILEKLKISKNAFQIKEEMVYTIKDSSLSHLMEFLNLKKCPVDMTTPEITTFRSLTSNIRLVDKDLRAMN